MNCYSRSGVTLTHILMRDEKGITRKNVMDVLKIDPKALARPEYVLSNTTCSLNNGPPPDTQTNTLVSSLEQIHRSPSTT